MARRSNKASVFNEKDTISVNGEDYVKISALSAKALPTMVRDGKPFVLVISRGTYYCGFIEEESSTCVVLSDAYFLHVSLDSIVRGDVNYHCITPISFCTLYGACNIIPLSEHAAIAIQTVLNKEIQTNESCT